MNDAHFLLKNRNTDFSMLSIFNVSKAAANNIFWKESVILAR